MHVRELFANYNLYIFLLLFDPLFSPFDLLLDRLNCFLIGTLNLLDPAHLNEMCLDPTVIVGEKVAVEHLSELHRIIVVSGVHCPDCLRVVPI